MEGGVPGGGGALGHSAALSESATHGGGLGSSSSQSKSVADLLSSFGLGKLAGGAAPGTGGMTNSSSMMQLLAALDSPTGRLTESVSNPGADADGGSNSLGGLGGSGANSASVNSLRGLLRSYSSTGSLDALGEGQLIDLQNFAALARNASLQTALGNLGSGPPSLGSPSHTAGSAPAAASGAMAPPQWPTAGNGRSPSGPASRTIGHSVDSEGMLVPTGEGAGQSAAERLGIELRDRMMHESPSVSSLVDLVRSTSATSLVDLMHSYSSTNLASLGSAFNGDGERES